MVANSKSFTKTPLFWALFCFIFCSGILFSFKYFSHAFPLVDLEITMDRKAALAKAQQLSEQYHWGPQNYNQVAVFDVDSNVQHFIELEAGGPQMFGQIIKEKYYSPYLWSVRHFKEYETTETEIFFTPEGKPYGFIQKIPENQPGAALSSDAARALALEYAQKDWLVDFSFYKEVEDSQEITSNGRIDHTFVYERTDKKVGQAPYRLKLVVRGDLFTELKLTIKVPESFTRKYHEMRSFNNTIAFTATIVMVLLYIFFIGLFGFFYLMRAHWLEWKNAFIWGFIIGALQALNSINQLPLWWLGYDTAVSSQKFIIMMVIYTIIQFLMFTSASTCIIMLAESLTRKAFPHKIQFWKLWSPHVGNSFQVLGRTITGYLILGFDFFYVIFFYYCTLRYFGWWSPSETLYNPNILSTYVPWLSPLALSLSAGFLEECLFRAIPLAGAALLGQKFGKKKLFIIIAFIIQAIVFSAAHANYAAQPAYARLIELLIPSTVFGLLYLCFGLLPAIISHFIFDVVWFALPVFIASTPGIWLDKLIIILVCLFPLLIVFYRRYNYGSWVNVASDSYNSAWQPPHHQSITVHELQEETMPSNKKRRIILTCAGVIGFIGWLVFSRFNFDILPLRITRSEALDYAHKKITISPEPWKFLANVESPLEHKQEEKEQHVYAWRVLGPSIYKKLLDTYLLPPVWKIRLAKFQGPAEDRAEEYELLLDKPLNTINLRRLHHTLPEGRSAESLTLEQARKKSYNTIQDTYGLSEDQLKEISAVPTKQPNRTDWVFTFSDTTTSVGQGQAHIKVEIDGPDAVDTYRSIFVPETWKREFKDEISFINLIATIGGLLLCFLLIMSALILIGCIRRHFIFNVKMFFFVFGALLLKSCIQSVNIWPLATIMFSTAQPFSHQAWHTINIWLVSALFKAGFFGFLVGFLQGTRFKSPQFATNFSGFIVLGIIFGVIEGGILACIQQFIPLGIPQWPDMTPAGAYLPWLSQVLMQFTTFIEATIKSLLIYTALDYLTDGWKRYRWLAIIFITFIIILTVALLIVELYPPFSVAWLIKVFCFGIIFIIIATLLYIYGIRFSRASFPIMESTFLTLKIIKYCYANPFPGAIIGSILAIILINSCALYWSYQLAYNKNGIPLFKHEQ